MIAVEKPHYAGLVPTVSKRRVSLARSQKKEKIRPCRDLRKEKGCQTVTQGGRSHRQDPRCPPQRKPGYRGPGPTTTQRVFVEARKKNQLNLIIYLTKRPGVSAWRKSPVFGTPHGLNAELGGAVSASSHTREAKRGRQERSKGQAAKRAWGRKLKGGKSTACTLP